MTLFRRNCGLLFGDLVMWRPVEPWKSTSHTKLRKTCFDVGLNRGLRVALPNVSVTLASSLT
jgi:hypothetical protein